MQTHIGSVLLLIVVLFLIYLSQTKKLGKIQNDIANGVVDAIPPGVSYQPAPTTSFPGMGPNGETITPLPPTIHIPGIGG